jgi:cytochrome P450
MELNQFDLADLEFWRRPLDERAAAFAALRAQPDLVFTAEPEPPPGFAPGPGFYSLTRHAEVVEASRHPELFCSGKGTNIGDMPPEFLEFFGSMINLDDPRHARFRRIVGFGGPGPHFCLGAHLARREVTVVFQELFRTLPDIRSVGEPDRLLSAFINGIKHLPAQWTPVGQ